MQLPTQITLSNLPPSPALGTRVRAMSWRLARTFPEIRSCQVRIEGGPVRIDGLHEYHVELRARMATRDLVAGASHASSVSLALRSAFTTMRRQLAVALRRDREVARYHAAVDAL